MKSRLYAGNVRHRRAGPRAYQFAYGVFYCCIDLDEVADVARRIVPFSYNGFNIMSFQDRDHLGAPGAPVRESVRSHLTERGLLPPGGSVSLLTNTRILNYVFNPVSFYFVRDACGALHHVIAEVHNTGGQRHVYDLARSGCTDTYTSAAAKEFYVSPFIDMDARYEFSIAEATGGALDIRIDEFRGDERFFEAELKLRPRPMTNANVARMLARYPLVTLKTIALIHWHGLKLWLRGERYRSNPHQGEARP